MKKTLLTILCALTTLCGMAQTETNYNEQYVVTVNGSSSDAKDGQQAIVDNGDGTVNFVLKDFSFEYAGQAFNVKNVNIKNLPAYEKDGLCYFSAPEDATFSIPANQLPSQYQTMSASFQNIPAKLEGKMNSKKLFAEFSFTITIKSIFTINIPVAVTVGTDDFPVAVTKIYSEQLLVTINGEASEPQATDVTVVDNGDGTINFVLKNFFLGAGEDIMPVGNIVVENVAVKEGEDGLKYISYEGNVAIQPGDMEGVEMWMGTMFGEIPLNLQGKMNDEKLYVTIDIDLADFGQTVHVELGTDDFVAPEPVGTVYNEQLLVTVNGEASEPQEASVTVYDNGNGTINFVLKNFYLGAGDETMPVGNIVVENVAVTEGEDGLKHISYEDNVAIQPGDEEGVEWVGPMFGPIPLNLQGKMNDEKLYVTINIDLAAFGQMVQVELGTDDFFPEPAVKKSYIESYYVTVEGMTSEDDDRKVNVNIYENNNGTIDFELEDFTFTVKKLKLDFGTQTLHELEAWDGENGKKYFEGERTISIPEDQIPAELKILLAFGFENKFPLKIHGWYDDEHLFAEFDTSVSIPSIGDFMVHVRIGSITGDMNGDNKVDIADAVTVLNIMASGEYKTVADLNDDGKVDIADFVTVLNIMAAQ